MTSERIRQLLAELRQEMQADAMDAETRASLKRLDEDLHRLLQASDDGSEGKQLVDQARQLEAEFAASHPVAERVIREIIDALVKLGL